ncbi:sugar phosphate isomerase/epimerase family protein [Qiania dongpingensis]|uniref:Sugar phosphate isomerase/epimerase n=1 Tax=Qiania dongpingensis TaxID=2763669 RepID=A0A7G9G276_9FIRM|nr:sugar phosphate isomerase/epimerase [Qiania dongpingensis]QNM04908.1 sugar phosphate isomerase/epimerase [Qiania dongpingensis]
MKYGAQTYAWQMSYGTYKGKIPHILDICAQAGFGGLEIETTMLGEYGEKPQELKKEFDKRNMTLTAVGVPLPWGTAEEDEILETARLSFDAAAPFGGILMSFSIIPPAAPFEKREREQKEFLEFLARLGEMAKAAGYPPSFHTNSSPLSLFHCREDYELLKRFFEDSGMGFTPDAGHIAHGGMDVEEIFRLFMPHICHVHFKDMGKNGLWTPMGEGVIPFPELLGCLKEADYGGWIAVEEESPQAVLRPDETMLQDGVYLQKIKL